MSSSTVSTAIRAGDVNAIQLVSKCVFKWEIHNFSGFSIMKSGQFIKSREFTSAKCLYRWQLRFYPMSDRIENREYSGLFLKSLEVVDIDAEFKFVILDDKNKIIKEVGPSKMKFAAMALGYSKFIERSTVMDKTKGMLTDDKLTIFCEININTVDSQWQNTVLCKQPDYSRELELSDNFEQLLNDKKFSDVKFIVFGKTLYAHKSVLSKRSPVFAAMFEHDMKENTENKVEINDIDYEVLIELFRYIYSGKVQEIETIAKDLLAAADKYALGRLKTICEEYLCENLSVDNALERLNIAVLYSVETLRRRVKDFIVVHAKEMAEKDQFNAIVDLDRHLIVEVIHDLALQEKS